MHENPILQIRNGSDGTVKSCLNDITLLSNLTVSFSTACMNIQWNKDPAFLRENLSVFPVLQKASGINEYTIAHGKHPVGHIRQLFVMSYDNKGLFELFTKRKEEFMKFHFVLGIKVS